MAVRRSTRIWLAVLAASIAVVLVDGPGRRLGGAARFFADLFAWLSGAVLCWRAAAAAFRVIVQRLTLRLAFSYFLIGIVPIPLLAAMFGAFSYLLAHQIIATRMRNAVIDMAALATATRTDLPSFRVGSDDRVVSSDVAWLPPGSSAPWARDLDTPHPLTVDGHVWIAIRSNSPKGTSIRLMPMEDGGAVWLQNLADRTGYDVLIRGGSGESTATGYEIHIQDKSRPKSRTLEFVSPHAAAPASRARGLWDRTWLTGIYLDRAVAAYGAKDAKRPVVAFLARTSPATLVGQLFAQGLPEVTRIVWTFLLIIASALLFVYLVALAIAFGLVASIVRNVNRLTRATRAVAKGDFTVRVRSKSRDQIGDLARSFDGMAESMEKLLSETARKEKLEAELAVARAVAESFLPDTKGNWKGFRIAAHFEPVADLGGDYYDIVPMPDGRTAISIGDVSGHGLPTALLAADSRASLSSLIEVGIPAEESFRRLELRTRRSRATDRRLYTTLALFAYDAARGSGTLTNAGHPAPYRVGRRGLARLDLPAVPIGLLPGRNGSYPSKEYAFEPGDRLVFFTDGIVEAADASEEPFGYERLEALLLQEGNLSGRELIDRILAAIAAHVGPTPLEDDRTLLVLSFEPT